MNALKKSTLAAVALALLAGASTPALADRDWHDRGDWDDGGRVHFGLYFGAPPAWSDWDYPPYYYYPPRVVVVPSSPPVYVQHPGAEAQHWWYYCADSKTYYPYVKQCPGGWQRVAPQPPG